MTQVIEIKVPDIGDFSDIPVVEVLVAAGDPVEDGTTIDAFALAGGAIPGSRAGRARLSGADGSDPEQLALSLAAPGFQWV